MYRGEIVLVLLGINGWIGGAVMESPVGSEGGLFGKPCNSGRLVFSQNRKIGRAHV